MSNDSAQNNRPLRTRSELEENFKRWIVDLKAKHPKKQEATLAEALTLNKDRAKKKSAKAKRPTYTPISNIAGSKQEIERIKELDRQRQQEVKQALIAEAQANPTRKANISATPATRPVKPKELRPAQSRPTIVWEGEKSEDILDSRARMTGNPFTGKRSR